MGLFLLNWLALLHCALLISALPLPPPDEDCLLASPSTPNPFPGTCGQYNKSRATGTPKKGSRIVGGKEALRGQFPWQVNMGACGASIIGERHLLTAAHCMHFNRYGIGSSVVVGGVMSDPSYADCTAQERTIVQAQLHPCYCSKEDYNRETCGPKANEITASNMTKFQYDVAVITVDKPFRFNKFVQPACLPQIDNETAVGTMVVTSGFGDLYHGGPSPDHLNYVGVPVISQTECKGSYGEKRVTDDMICAGYPEGEKDSCSGDSGGPLVEYDEDTGDAVLIGVVSWGLGCAAPNKPGVYAKVANVIEWIQEVLENKTTPVDETTHGRFQNQLCYDYLLNRSLINATIPRPTTTTTTTTTTRKTTALATTIAMTGTTETAEATTIETATTAKTEMAETTTAVKASSATIETSGTTTETTATAESAEVITETTEPLITTEMEETTTMKATTAATETVDITVATTAATESAETETAMGTTTEKTTEIATKMTETTTAMKTTIASTETVETTTAATAVTSSAATSTTTTKTTMTTTTTNVILPVAISLSILAVLFALLALLAFLF